jgi:hypothetical protein
MGSLVSRSMASFDTSGVETSGYLPQLVRLLKVHSLHARTHTHTQLVYVASDFMFSRRQV